MNMLMVFPVVQEHFMKWENVDDPWKKHFVSGWIAGSRRLSRWVKDPESDYGGLGLGFACPET